MNFKLNKTLVIWIIIVMSVLALGIQASLYFRVAKVPVLKTDIPAGKQITRDMIELVDVNPSSSFLKNAVTNVNDLFNDGNPNGANNGKYTLVPLFKGQIIDKKSVTNSLTDPAFGLGAALEDENHVAITILLPIQNAVGVSLKAGQKVNLTYAIGVPSSALGEGITIDRDTLKEIKGVQVLDIKNEKGLKILDGNTPTGKKVYLTLSVPVGESPNISLAASGQGIVYISLPSISAQNSMPISSGSSNTQTIQPTIVPEEQSASATSTP